MNALPWIIGAGLAFWVLSRRDEPKRSTRTTRRRRAPTGLEWERYTGSYTPPGFEVLIQASGRDTYYTIARDTDTGRFLVQQTMTVDGEPTKVREQSDLATLERAQAQAQDWENIG